MEDKRQKNKIQQILAQSFLFSRCTEEHLEKLLDGCILRVYNEGEELKSYDAKPFLCIIIKGSALVYSKDENNDLLLRILKDGDTFGVATLFGKSQDASVTKILAEAPTEALCIHEEAVRMLILKDGDFAMRYIDFLADRIRFLNQRIACIGAGSAEEKVCAWIDHQIPSECQTHMLTVSMSYTRIADTLGLSRASLYRAMDELESRGLIHREGKSIHVLDHSALHACQ